MILPFPKRVRLLQMGWLPGLVIFLLLTGGAANAADEKPTVVEDFKAYTAHEGFFDFWWDAKKGRVLLQIERLEEPFLYQSALARGIGSNDLGLDRGQLGATRIVEFQRSGPKVLLLENNLDYRALGGSDDEREAIEESFARSVLWGFEILSETDAAVVVDATEFLLRDSHDIESGLAKAKAGAYKLSASRSAIYLPRSKSFPDNTEFEAIVTFVGQPEGELIPSVVPDPTAITVYLHHSFIRLPDSNYQALPYDPRSGLIGLSYENSSFLDYSAAIGDDIRVAYARRHRLHKRDPGAALSEPVQPIVYYMDRGAAEPVRSALMEGASWWNQAFTAAGYKDGFRVELLPEGVDPMDVRYNVIQWVHRSTRGWSYGSSVVDPRSGEILKGHVTLGSLRVRQDFLIAEGLLAPYGSEQAGDPMLDMSLARIRQLAAHEVGHTLGLQHNFAASTQQRASVMDYPVPLIRFDDNGLLDLSDAYAVGMGAWDERVILYGYQDFPVNTDALAARAEIMAETIATGFRYVGDGDSRDPGSANPDGNLWDNGSDAVEELQHLLRVRDYALARFSEHNIRLARPMASLEEVLVPLYLLHRYQLQAVGKLVGGQYFSYALRGDGQTPTALVPAQQQRRAMTALIDSIDPAVLQLSDALIEKIPPRPPGYPRTREMFPSASGGTFDPLGPPLSAVSLTLDVLLHPARAVRMNNFHAQQADMPSFTELTDLLMRSSWYASQRSGLPAEIQRATNQQVLQRLLQLSARAEINPQVRAIALAAVQELRAWLAGPVRREKNPAWRAHYMFAAEQVDLFLRDPDSVKSFESVKVPPGSPLGG